MTDEEIEAGATAVRDYRHRHSRFRLDYVVDDEHRNLASAVLKAAETVRQEIAARPDPLSTHPGEILICGEWKPEGTYRR